MKTLLFIIAATAAVLLPGCESSTYDAPSFGSGVEPRDATSPTGSITDHSFMR
jgi:hypothetical protein